VRDAARRSDRVRYERQAVLQPSAEESMCTAVRHATGDYVWTIGDDDLPHVDALDVLLPLLHSRRYDFALLNVDIVVKDKRFQYLRATPGDLVQYERGQDLFKDLGLIAVTATLSSLCFNRAAFLEFAWVTLQAEATIYSHTAGLLAIFYKRPCALLVRPVIDYTLNALNDEFGRFQALAKTRGQSTYFPFTVGLCRLFRLLMETELIAPDTFFGIEEIEFDKFYLRPEHKLLPVFVLRFVVFEIRATARDRAMLTAEDWRVLASVYRHDAAWSRLLRAAHWLYRVRRVLPGWALRSAIRKLWRRIDRLQENELARRWAERAPSAGAWLDWPGASAARKPLRGMAAALPPP
jgi:hypothetical protein